MDKIIQVKFEHGTQDYRRKMVDEVCQQFGVTATLVFPDDPTDLGLLFVIETPSSITMDILKVFKNLSDVEYACVCSNRSL